VTTGPLYPEVRCGLGTASQAALPLASEGVQRFVWQMAHGQILIEIRDGVAYVNGDRVEPIADTLRRLDGGRSNEQTSP